jgi:hypothetical protein
VEIIGIQKKDRYDLMYQKAQQLGSKIIQWFGIEDNQGNIVTDHRQALSTWEKYLQDLYDRKIAQNVIAIEAETNWMKMAKDLLYLKVR